MMPTTRSWIQIGILVNVFIALMLPIQGQAQQIPRRETKAIPNRSIPDWLKRPLMSPIQGQAQQTPRRETKVIPKQATPTWVKQLGIARDDVSIDVATDRNGNVYITGRTEGALGGTGTFKGAYDAWVAKYSNSGTRLWIKQLGTSREDYSAGVATDSNGNVYITGRTEGSLGGPNKGFFDAWVAKYNSSGTQLWVRQRGTTDDDTSNGVATDNSGNVYITGITQVSGGSSFGNFDAWVAKYNSSGTQLWVKYLSTTSDDQSIRVATDTSGNVYITGDTDGALGEPNKGNDDAWVAKFNSSGTQQWIRQLGTTGEDHSYGVATDSNGNVYITGETEGALGGTKKGQVDAWVAKYNSSGTRLWIKQLGTAAIDVSYDVATDSSGNAYVTGGTYGALVGVNKGDLDAWVAKYNSSGTRLWIKQLGTTVYDRSIGAATDLNGYVYITGGTDGALGGTNKGGEDAWVAKFDSNP